MIASLQFRLFLTATLIVAMVLAAVLSIGWSRVLRFETARLDKRLCSESRRLSMEHFPAHERQRLEADILGKLQLSNAGQLLLRVDSDRPEQSYQSPHWDDVAVLQNQPQRAHAEPRSGDAPPPRDVSLRPGNSDCKLHSFTFRGSEWRAARTAQRDIAAIVAADMVAPRSEIQSTLFGALALIVPLALLLAAMGAAMLASLMMRPVNRLRESMKNVTPQDLNRRLPIQGETKEFKELTSAYNSMLDRLERSFRQASRFSADAAHELKTPLTILRGRIEQAMRHADSAKLQDDLSELLDEVSRLAAITRKLLLLSQSDAGRLEITRTPIDLTALLNELLADAQMVLSDQRLVCSVESNLILDGDPVLLRQLFNNLLSNAIRYSTGNKPINVQASLSGGMIRILFSNTCRPIDADERLRFFERFYRGDISHNRAIDGNGLGLSLAQEIAKAHGGNLTLESSPIDQVNLLLVLPQK